MGMFDVLACEYELPERKEFQDKTFQTKNLGTCMKSFRITKDGELLRYHRQDKEEFWIHYPHFGRINFYTFADDEYYQLGGGQSGWIEYQSTFKDGWLQAIELYDYKAPERKNEG